MRVFKLAGTAVVTASLVACGGGGGVGTAENDTPVTPAAYSISTSPKVDFGMYDVDSMTNTAQTNEYSGRGLGRALYKAMDVNGDGYDDLIYGFMTLLEVFKPVVLFYNPTTKKFAPDPQFQSVVPEMQHPRVFLQIDADGDGRKDLFFSNHGYDDLPYGEQNVLILHTENGFVNATDTLPRYRDYTHGAVTADFFQDGYDDLLMLNSWMEIASKCERNLNIPTLQCDDAPANGNSYLLSNNGTGTLTEVKLDAALNFTPDNDPRLSLGAAGDLNNDGIPDIVATYIGQLAINRPDGKIKIMESYGIGKYNTAAEFPNKFLTDTNCSGDKLFGTVAIVDLDEDGKNEILTWESCDWKNRIWRVFGKNASNTWIDRTDEFFPETQSTEAQKSGWCFETVVEDVNGDGAKDITCTNGKGLPDSLWINTNGEFYKSTFTDNNLDTSAFTNNLIIKLKDEKYFLQEGITSMGIFLSGWRIK